MERAENHAKIEQHSWNPAVLYPCILEKDGRQHTMSLQIIQFSTRQRAVSKSFQFKMLNRLNGVLTLV